MTITTQLPASAQRVADLLTQRGHDKSVVMLDATGITSAKAASGLGCDVAAIAKSIVFRRRSDDTAVMVIASGENRVDEIKVAAIVGEIDKANAKFIREHTGYAIGGVCPIGHIRPTVILIDQDLLKIDSLWAGAGHPHAIFNLTPAQLVEMTAAAIADVACQKVA